MAQNGSTSASVVIGAKTVDALTQLKKLSGELRTLRQEIKDFNSQKVANPFSTQKTDPQVQMWKTQAADAARLETMLSSNHAKNMRRGGETIQQNRALSSSSQEMHAALRGASGAVGLLWMTYSRYIPAMAAGFLSVAGTVGTMSKSIREGMDFDYQTRFVSAVDDNPDNTSKSVQAGLIENTKDSIFNLNENARALRVLSQTGVDAATGVKLLSTTMKAATLGETEMKQAAEDLTSTLVVFNLASKNSDEYAANYKRAGDITAWVAKETKANFSEVSKSLQGVVGVAREYGVTLEEIAAMSAVLGKQGIVGPRSGTYTRSAVESLYVPTSKQAEKLFKELDFKAFDQITKEPKAFAEVLQDLVSRLKTLNKEAQSNAIAKIFPAWAAKAFRSVNGDLDEFLSIFTRIINATGELDGAFTKLSASYKIQIDQMQADWDNAFTLAFQVDDGEFKEVITEIRTILQSPEFIEGLKAMVTLGVEVIVGAAKAGVEVYKVGQTTSQVSRDISDMMARASTNTLKLADDFLGISTGIGETRSAFANFVEQMDQAKTTGSHPQGIIGTILFNAFDFRNYGTILDQIKSKIEGILGLSSKASRLDDLIESTGSKQKQVDMVKGVDLKDLPLLPPIFKSAKLSIQSLLESQLEADKKGLRQLVAQSIIDRRGTGSTLSVYGPSSRGSNPFVSDTLPDTPVASPRGTGTLRDQEADRAAETARKRAAQEYENLDEKIANYIKGVQESVATGRKLTEGDRLNIQLKEKYGENLEKLGAKERAHQQTQLKQIEIYDTELRVREEIRNYQSMDSEFTQTLQQTVGAEKSRAQQMQAQLDFKKELNEAQRAELQILVEQVRIQERLNILKDAQREVEDSAIGSMRIDRERERAQMEATHRRRVEDIKLQEAGGRDPSMVAADMEAENIKYTEQIRQYTLKWEGSFADGVDRAFANYINSVGTMADQSERLFSSSIGNLEGELTKFVKTGKFSFADLSEAFIDELIKMEVRMAASEFYKLIRGGLSSGGGESSGGGGFFGGILSSVGDWFGGLDLFANGGVPGGKGISAYSNKIVNSPTIFPFARGTGLMGEAGPEAIMPLTRVNGKLGVQAVGNGGGANVQVNIINNGNAQVKTQERQQGNSRIIDVMIEQVKDAVAQDINSGRGSVSSALNKTFQLSRVPSSF